MLLKYIFFLLPFFFFFFFFPVGFLKAGFDFSISQIPSIQPQSWSRPFCGYYGSGAVAGRDKADVLPPRQNDVYSGSLGKEAVA